MPSTITPNMNLISPTVGQEPGPQYAIDIDNSLTLIDAHDHSPGHGVLITPTGLNINASLPLNNNKLTTAASVEFTSQSSLADLRAIYTIGNDLYYNDGAGNVIRVTQSGSVVNGGGSITGLVAPASATYAAGTFTWQSNTNTPAAMDNGPVTIREQVVNGKGITLTAPAGLAANYSLTLPGANPASAASILLTNASGVQSYLVPGSSGLPLVSGGASLSYAQIGPAAIATGAVTAAKLAAPASTVLSLSSGSLGGTGSQTLTAGSITSSGFRPFMLHVQGNGGNSGLRIGSGGTSGVSASMDLYIDGVVVQSWQFETTFSTAVIFGITSQWPISFTYMGLTPLSVGTHSINVAVTFNDHGSAGPLLSSSSGTTSYLEL